MKYSRILLLLLVLSLGSSVLAASSQDQLLQNYIAQVQKKIKRNWKPKRASQSHVVLTNFVIDESGQVKDIKILKHGIDQEADNLAVNAIKNSAPFVRPVALKNDGDFEIEFSFDYTLSKEKANKNIFSTISDSVLVEDRFAIAPRRRIRYPVWILLFLLVMAFRVYRFLRGKVTKNSKGMNKAKTAPPNRYDPTNA